MDLGTMSNFEHLGRLVADELDAATQPASVIHRARRRALASWEASRLPVRRPVARFVVRFAMAAALVLFVVLAVRARSSAPLAFVVGTESAPRAVGAWIAAGDAAVPIRFSDGTELTLAPGGRARVTQADRNGARLLLERGSIHGKVVHRSAATRWSFAAGPFEVEVVGTELDTAWDPQRDVVEVDVVEGRVLVRGPQLDGSQSVVSGQRLRVAVSMGGAETPPKPPGDCAGASGDCAGASGDCAVGVGDGAVGSKEGAVGSKEGAAGSKEGAAGSKEGAAGSKEGAAGSKEGAAGVGDGAAGVGDGAVGSKDGAAELKLGAAELKDGGASSEDGGASSKCGGASSKCGAASSSVERGAPADWRALAALGRHREAMALVLRDGFVVVLARSSTADLGLLADTARYAGDYGHAREALFAARVRGARGSTAFLLGKIAADNFGATREAIGWFETVLVEGGGGALAEPALGRLIELKQRAGDRAGASAAAQQYLLRYPNGSYQSLAGAVAAP